jgi:hypothetical protein
MPFIRCVQPAEALAAYDRLATSRADGLFLIFGSEDPQTGQSWCADCVTADPVLRVAIAQALPTVPCYECPVGARSAWKGVADHPFRLHGALRIARIPTLIRFRAGAEIGRLVEGDCAKPELVAAFLR